MFVWTRFEDCIFKNEFLVTEQKNSVNKSTRTTAKRIINDQLQSWTLSKLEIIVPKQKMK